MRSKHPIRRGPRLARPKRPATAGFLRRARFEALEPRLVLSTTLAPIGDQAVLAGAPLPVALDGFDDEGDPLSYEVSVDGSSPLTAQVLDGNRSLRMSVDGFGDMVFALFEGRAPRTTGRIIDLAESGFYDGLTFHRIIQDFMIQGGDPLGNGTGGSGINFDDEFDPGLQHTTAGLLSMAKSSDDTNDSQFFITAGPTRHLDFNHSVFGFLTEGDDVRRAIASVDVEPQSPPTTDNPNPEVSKPVHDVVITSMTVFVDQENGVLVLSAPEGTTGAADVTVTVHDPGGATAQETFHVDIQPDDTNANPFLGVIDPIRTTADTPVGFDIPALDVEGDAISYAGVVFPTNDNLDIAVSAGNGHAVVTPSGGLVGVHGVFVGARKAVGWDGSSWDTQAVPVFIAPAPPSGIRLVDALDTGPDPNDLITSQNNGPAGTLVFEVSGVVPGAEVTLFLGGVAVGQAVAQGDTVQITADGAGELADGVYGLTAKQVLRDQPVTIGNLNQTVDLQSELATPVTLTVDTQAPVILSVAELQAAEGRPYQYDVESNEEPGGRMIYRLLTAPTGMTIPNPADGRIAWTPGSGQAGSHPVVVQAMDAAGNTAEQAFDVQVAEAPKIDPLGGQDVDEGSPVTFTATASGGIGALTFSLDDGAPSEAAIDPDTGEFHWTPGEEFGPSVRPIVVRVTDATGASATETVNVKIREVNQPPILGPVADRTIDEGEPLVFDLVARDDDLPKNPLAYEVSGEVPDGAAVQPVTGRFTWTPDESQGGKSFLMTARVWDFGDVPGEQTFRVTVREVDDPPAFAPVDGARLRRGGRLELDLNATDPDLPANEVRYRLDPGAPEGAAIDPINGRLTWNVPLDEPPGLVALTVRATEVLPNGQPGAESTVVVPVTVAAVFPPAVNDIALMLLNEASERGTAGAGANGSGRSSREKEAIDLQALGLGDLSMPSGGEAPGGGTPEVSLAAAELSNGPVGGNALFGMQFDPGAGSGGGTIPGEQNEPPGNQPQQPSGQQQPSGEQQQPTNKSGKQAPGEQAEPTGKPGDSQAPAAEQPSGDEADKPHPNQQSRHQPALNDAAIQSLVEAAVTTAAAPPEAPQPPPAQADKVAAS